VLHISSSLPYRPSSTALEIVTGFLGQQHAACLQTQLTRTNCSLHQAYATHTPYLSRHFLFVCTVSSPLSRRRSVCADHTASRATTGISQYATERCVVNMQEERRRAVSFPLQSYEDLLFPAAGFRFVLNDRIRGREGGAKEACPIARLAPPFICRKETAAVMLSVPN
jgi:hypothetical protein